METRTITYSRVVHTKVEAARALELRERGLSLSEIKAALGTDATLATVSRAIARAKRPKGRPDNASATT